MARSHEQCPRMTLVFCTAEERAAFCEVRVTEKFGPSCSKAPQQRDAVKYPPQQQFGFRVWEQVSQFHRKVQEWLSGCQVQSAGSTCVWPHRCGRICDTGVRAAPSSLSGTSTNRSEERATARNAMVVVRGVTCGPQLLQLRADLTCRLRRCRDGPWRVRQVDPKCQSVLVRPTT